MARSWRGYRLLVLEGRRFRWACSFNDPAEIHSTGYAKHGESWSADILTVRPEECPHRLLTVNWPACKGPVVTPGFVRACVEEALRRGWLAERPVLGLNGSDVIPEPFSDSDPSAGGLNSNWTPVASQ